MVSMNRAFFLFFTACPKSENAEGEQGSSFGFDWVYATWSAGGNAELLW